MDPELGVSLALTRACGRSIWDDALPLEVLYNEPGFFPIQNPIYHAKDV